MDKYHRAMQDPAAIFTSPTDIITDQELSKMQKIEILRAWEFQARELEVADEENMGGPQLDLLDDILNALRQLGAHR